MGSSILILLISVLVCVHVEGGCYKNCNRNGVCSETSICQCFTGFEGSDCSRRSCPTGPALGTIPYDTDSAHQSMECSGRGSCDYELGMCKCDPGFGGTACDRMECMNKCSGHGECMSLRNAAKSNDGYLYNRTTTYTLWDADVMYGCKCDYGYDGADCSMKMGEARWKSAVASACVKDYLESSRVFGLIRTLLWIASWKYSGALFSASLSMGLPACGSETLSDADLTLSRIFVSAVYYAYHHLTFPG